MLFVLKSMLHTLLLPPAAPLLLAAAGAVLLGRAVGGGARRAGWVLLITALAALWLLSTPLVAEALSRAAQRCPPFDLTQPVQAQAVVILGGEGGRVGAPEYGGEPSAELTLLERLSYGAFIARRTHLPILITSNAVEARAMQVSLARDFNMATRWVDNRSRDTFENAEFSARLLKPEGVTRIILVTDAEHEWRATREFATAGFSVVPAPVGLYMRHRLNFVSYVPTATALMRSNRALYELLGEVVRVTLATLGLRRHAP